MKALACLENIEGQREPVGDEVGEVGKESYDGELDFILRLMEALKVLKSGKDLIRFTFLENSSGCFVEKRSWEGKNRSQDLLRGYFCCDQSLKVTLK